MQHVFFTVIFKFIVETSHFNESSLIINDKYLDVTGLFW